jgi:hypothetical protein
LRMQIEGKGRALGGKWSIKWKFLWFWGTNTAFSATSDKFRVRHEPRNMREIRNLNRFSIREREKYCRRSRERERDIGLWREWWYKDGWDINTRETENESLLLY